LEKLSKYDTTKRGKKHKKWDVIVLRVSKTGSLGMSKPCKHCLLNFKNSFVKIKNIYYSNSEGKIECKSLTNLLNEKNPHISRLRSTLSHE